MPAAVKVVYRRRSPSMPRRRDQSSDLPTLHCRVHRIMASAGGTPIGKAAGLRREVPAICVGRLPPVVSFVHLFASIMCMMWHAATEKSFLVYLIRPVRVLVLRGGHCC